MNLVTPANPPQPGQKIEFNWKGDRTVGIVKEVRMNTLDIAFDRTLMPVSWAWLSGRDAEFVKPSLVEPGK